LVKGWPCSVGTRSDWNSIIS